MCTDYLTKFEELIESYNAGSRNIEELFKELLALSQALSEEEPGRIRSARRSSSTSSNAMGIARR
jgi:hypothetical protein